VVAYYRTSGARKGKRSSTHGPISARRSARRHDLNERRGRCRGGCDSLERKDLVARRPDAGDRRRNVILLTDAGQATLQAATAASDAAERELLAELDDREATQLRELLNRITSPRAQR
jgi:DNA-binding MarR family transcriptional regulator